MSGSAFRREHVSGCGLSAHPMQQCSDPKDTWMSMLVVSPAHLRLVGLIRFSSVHCWPSRKLDVIRFRWGALARNRNRNRSKPLKFPSIQWQLSGQHNLQGSSTNIFGRQREEFDFLATNKDIIVHIWFANASKQKKSAVFSLRRSFSKLLCAIWWVQCSVWLFAADSPSSFIVEKTGEKGKPKVLGLVGLK